VSAHELRLFPSLLFICVTLICSARFRSSTRCCPANISSITIDHDELFELPIAKGGRLAKVKVHRAGGSGSGFRAACLNPATSKSRSRSERMPTSQLAFTAENPESFSTGFSICSSSVRFLSDITALPARNVLV
jgi:hypothetical protein